MHLVERIRHQRGEVIMQQGALPFQYEIEGGSSGLTALAGLPVYLELSAVMGLRKSIEEHVKVRCGRQVSLRPTTSARGVEAGLFSLVGLVHGVTSGDAFRRRVGPRRVAGYHVDGVEDRAGTGSVPRARPPESIR